MPDHRAVDPLSNSSLGLPIPSVMEPYSDEGQPVSRRRSTWWKWPLIYFGGVATIPAVMMVLSLGDLLYSNAKLVTACHELEVILREFQHDLAANPAEREFLVIAKNVLEKSRKISASIASSKNPNKAHIMRVIGIIHSAAKKKTSPEAVEVLQDAEQRLEAAKHALGM